MAAMQPSLQTSRISNEDMNAYIGKIGALLRRNQVSKNNGKDDKFVQQIDEAYRQFTDSVKDQEEWMKTATDEQREVFRGITENFYKLRRADAKDFDALHKEFKAAVVRLNEIDGDHPAKGELEHLASIGMKHTDPNAKKKGGVLRQEFSQRAAKFFKPTQDDLESPLFRKLAGLEKNGAGVLNPLHELQNQGTAEKLIREAGEQITGEAEKDKANAMASQIAGGSGEGKGSGGFPSKIENLHVENLIVKMVKKAEDEQPPRYMQDRLDGPKGRSAVPINPELPGPSSSGAELHPQLPGPHGPTGALVDPKPHVPLDQKALEYHEPHLLPAPKIAHKELAVQDVEHREVESPIKVKPRNPHAPLKTQESPIASAVRGAVDVYPTFVPKPTITDAFKPKSDLPDNDVGPRSADPTLKIDDNPQGDAAAKEGSDSSITSEVIGDATSLLPALFGAKKGVRSLSKLAKLGKGLGKGLLKGGAAALVGYAADKGLGYAHDELEKTGHDQLAIGADVARKAADWGATGAAVGSFIPGVGTMVGGAVGGIAGAADGVYENWNKIDKSWMPEWMGGPHGKVDVKPAPTHDVQQVANHSANHDAPKVVVQQNISQPQQSGPKVVPVKAEPRARESYFDRQMMNTVLF
jgi:hypothetical protein